MQTVNLQYNVPAGYSLEEFVAKVNSYVARLAKKCQAGEEYEPNEETKAAIREAQAHIEAYKRGEEYKVVNFLCRPCPINFAFFFCKFICHTNAVFALFFRCQSFIN